MIAFLNDSYGKLIRSEPGLGNDAQVDIDLYEVSNEINKKSSFMLGYGRGT